MTTKSLPSSTDNLGGEKRYRKPQVDLYTVLLAISLVAILIGIIFLCLYNNEFEWKMKDSSIITSMITEGWNAGSRLFGILG